MEKFLAKESIKDSYDIVIIGGGPAGITAAVYASRDELSTLVLEKFSPGGQMAVTSHVDNYTGFTDTPTGFDLAEHFYKHGTKFGADIKYGRCNDIKIEGNKKLIFMEGRETPIEAKAVIIATGSFGKKLGVPGESKFWGRGISGCATCDGGFYIDKDVAVVGGGNSAIEDAIYLTRFAKKVYLIHRRDAFRCELKSKNSLCQNNKIEQVLNSEIVSINGELTVNSVTVINNVTQEKRDIAIGGLFVSIGQAPNSKLLNSVLELDDTGHYKAKEDTITNIEGIFVAGDVRSKEIRQIVTAAADGSVAAKMASRYIENL